MTTERRRCRNCDEPMASEVSIERGICFFCAPPDAKTRRAVRNPTSGGPKTAFVLGFEPGILEVYGKEYGDKAGYGCLIFDEDDIEWEPHDDRNGGFFRVKLDRSELLEIARHITLTVDA